MTASPVFSRGVQASTSGGHPLTRRNFFGVLGVGTVGLGLSACSTSTPSGPATGDAKKGTITVWSWTTAADAIRSVVPGFNKEFPDIKVEVQDVGNPAIWDKITAGMAAGGKGLADVLHIGVDYLPRYLVEFPDGLADLSALGADKHEPAFAKGLWESVLNQDGKACGMPWEANPAGFFYRSDMFETAGVDPNSIEVWDDLVEAGTAVKAKTGAQLIGIDKPAATADAANYFALLLQLQGTYYFNADGDIMLTSAESVRAMTILKSLNDAGLIADSSGEGTFDALVKADKLSVVPNPAWFAGYAERTYTEQSGKWRIMQPPAVEAGGSRSAIPNSSYLTVAGSSENQKAAYSFVEYALTKPDAINAMFKSEGVFPALTAAYDDPAFAKEFDFYGGQKIYDIFTAEMEAGAAPTNYTDDYPRALKLVTDAQTKVFLQGADPADALKEAADQLASQTGRKLGA